MTPRERRNLKNNMAAFVVLPILVYGIVRMLFYVGRLRVQDVRQHRSV